MSTALTGTGTATGRLRPAAFFLGLLLLCASTLMYEITLTRLLSVVSWYYLAFVSISMAMFGMTAGALAVQFRPDLFTDALIPRRLVQAALAMAISLPLSLMTMLAVPLYVVAAAQTVFDFLLFSAIISVPFFFSGIAVCLSLTRMPFPMGRIYFADLMGAATGCIGSVILLGLIDAPSAVFMVSALLFSSGALYAAYARESRLARTAGLWALALVVLSLLNASTFHGIQPVWSKGKVDTRSDILAERWNPISRVRATHPVFGNPALWGPSPKLPPSMQTEAIQLTIDSDAATPMGRFQGDLSAFPFLRYDVTSVGAQLRHGGGSAAIIGVGGGRDVLNCAVNGFRRIVGIEVNSAVVDLTSRQFDWYSGFSKIPGFELHKDEGRSYLTRSGERFDLDSGISGGHLGRDFRRRHEPVGECLIHRRWLARVLRPSQTRGCDYLQPLVLRGGDQPPVRGGEGHVAHRRRAEPGAPPGRDRLGQYRDSSRQQPAIFGIGSPQAPGDYR